MARKSIYPASVKPGIPKIGIKPLGWQETTFSDLLEVVERPAVMDDETEYQLVTAKRNRGGIVAREVLKGQDILTKTQFYVRSGDFLISKRQIIHGACGVVSQQLDGAIVSNEYATLRPKQGLLLDFLKHFSHTLFFQQTCFHASVGVDVEKMIFDLNDWLKYKVYIPQLEEQHKITETLNTWDRAITLTSQLILASQQRKQGLVQQLLVGKIRFSEFTQSNKIHLGTEIDLLPQDWRVAKLGEISTFLDEQRKPIKELDRANIQGPYPYYGASGVIDYVNNYIFDDDLILLGEDGENIVSRNTRLAFQISGKTWVNNHAHVIKPHKNVNITYLTEYLESLSYDRYNTGTAQPKLNKATCLNINILLPSLPEQRRIAEVLQACDREIALLQQKRDLLKQQKQGLMQQLLTGRVRVAVDLVEA